MTEPSPLPDPEDTAAHCRLQAEYLRRQADKAPSIEMRTMLLEGAQRLTEMAEAIGDR